MAKTESTFKNMALSLTVISLVASACLGFVYELTKEPIAASVLSKKLNAISNVVPEFDNDPNAEMFRIADYNGDSLEVYPAMKGGDTIGFAVNTFTTKGFSGNISLMAGFDPDGTIIDITVLEQKETPGLGTKMAEPEFKDQFKGVNPGGSELKVVKDGGQVDAITAATISSRAFCDAVNKAYDALQKGGLK